jgi:hypothetical protein
LKITGPVEAKNSWREIEAAYKAQFPSRKVLYSRFEKGEGHIGVGTHKQEEAKLKEETKMKLGTEEFVIREPTAAEMEKFWADHGSHFNLCTSKKLTLSSNILLYLIELKKKKAEKEKRNMKIAVKLGDYTYFL